MVETGIGLVAIILMLGVPAIAMLILLIMSVEIVRPVEVRLVERLGKYVRTLDQGLSFVIPFLENTISVNLTEQMVDVAQQTVITRDKLNVIVDAVVYYKINNPKSAIYNIDDHKSQLVSLSRTTLRAVIGQMTLSDANEKRSEINSKIEEILDKETASYGVDVLRVEIQEFLPPKDVIESMNNVVKAEQEKIAAREIALSLEIKADGQRLAAIKSAEGEKQSQILKAQGKRESEILEAEGKAKAIELVNEAARKYFEGNAQVMRRLEVAENSLINNTKLIVPSGSNLLNVIGDLVGINGNKEIVK